MSKVETTVAWLREGYFHCHHGEEVWCTTRLNHAADEIERLNAMIDLQTPLVEAYINMPGHKSRPASELRAELEARRDKHDS